MAEANFGTFPATLEISGAVNSENKVTTRVYKRRYWMLFVFSLTYFLNGVMISRYASMANLYGCYYDVSQDAINWTVIMFMVACIVLLYPAAVLTNYIDLRWTVICGEVSNTAGCALQFLTTKANSFPYVMGSTFLGSLACVFQISVPPFLAAKWFPSSQLSAACAIGLIGSQLGVSIGFSLSPLMIPVNCTETTLIEDGIFKMAAYLTGINSFTLILCILTFQNAPELPPSQSQLLQKEEIPESNFAIVLNVMKNKNFLLIFIMYGPMAGIVYALGTTLNSLMLNFFPNNEAEIGWMGMLFILTGIIGTVLNGCFLDYTRKFKQSAIGICALSLISYIIFTCLLNVRILWLQFVTIGLFGLFLMAFLVVGYEYGIEVTYPQPEVVTASLLNISMNLFGIILTISMSHFLTDWSTTASNVFVCVIILVCGILASFITTEYKRSQKNQELKCQP